MRNASTRRFRVIGSGALAAAAALTLTGCGVAQDYYDAARAELATVLGERDALAADLGAAQENYATLTANKARVTEQKAGVQAEFSEFRESMSVFAELSEAEASNRLEEERLGAEVARLNAEIAAQQAELERLQNLIVRTGEEPRRVGAGNWYIGQDIPAGRYQISNGSSNFFVRRGGRSVVNIILGGRLGVDTYVFTFQPGDVIEARGAFTLTAVE